MELFMLIGSLESGRVCVVYFERIVLGLWLEIVFVLVVDRLEEGVERCGCW